MENINLNPGHRVVVTKARTADYKYRIANDLPLPAQPYSLEIFEGAEIKYHTREDDYSKGSLTYTHTQPYKSSFYLNSFMDHIFKAHAKQSMAAANNKVLEGIKQQSLPIIQLYKERKETAKTLAKLVDDAVYIARNVKRPAKVFKHFGASTKTRHFRSVRRQVKDALTVRMQPLGNVWLQYRMFLMPTYHDVLDGVKAASDFEKKLHTESLRKGTKIQDRDTISNIYGNTYLGFPTAYTPISWEVKGGVSVYIQYDITDASLAGLSSIQNAAAAAWDLMPYSFIVDRFADIGTYLDLVNATAGTKFKSGCLSWMLEYNASIDSDWVWTQYPNRLLCKLEGYTMTYVGSASGSCKYIYTGRSLLADFPQPVLEFPFRQGVKQILDQVALLRNLLDKRFNVHNSWVSTDYYKPSKQKYLRRKFRL